MWPMARSRKSTRPSKPSNLEPSVMSLTFNTTPAGPATGLVYDYIDLSQVASLVNRRFYRQGLNWAVAGIKVFSLSGFVGSIRVSKLPNTWVMSNAWEKSMRTWNKMNSEALAESESIRPRFLDFKIYADTLHHTAGIAANLMPASSTNFFAPGEWESSKVVMPAADPAVPGSTSYSRELVAVGASFPGPGASGLDAVSLIEGYAASRLLPNVLDPNAPADAADAAGVLAENWMAAIFNDGTTQDEIVLDDMISENNIAPYPFENDGVNADTQYPNGANQGSGLQIHDFEFITPTTIGGTSRIKGGNFPCGLIQIETTNSGPLEGLTLIVDLIPGRHRGYLAEAMTEM